MFKLVDNQSKMRGMSAGLMIFFVSVPSLERRALALTAREET
jgi:hypothetical protein